MGLRLRNENSTKPGLTAEEVKKLEGVTLNSPEHDHARNLWLFSFYFAGIRISGVLRMRWSDIPNDRLHYSMGKNNKPGSLKIPEKALHILKQYEALRVESGDLVFPELKSCDFEDKFATQRTIAFKTSAIDKTLRLHVAPEAKITKKLTMHLARHTFGNLSGDKIPIQMLQKLYRHSSITTTIGYQGHFIHKDADDALDSVLLYLRQKTNSRSGHRLGVSMNNQKHTLGYIKRQAKKIKKERNITHTEALEFLATENCYSNGKHFQRSLAERPSSSVTSIEKVVEPNFTDWPKKHRN